MSSRLGQNPPLVFARVYPPALTLILGAGFSLALLLGLDGLRQFAASRHMLAGIVEVEGRWILLIGGLVLSALAAGAVHRMLCRQRGVLSLAARLTAQQESVSQDLRMARLGRWSIDPATLQVTCCSETLRLPSGATSMRLSDWLEWMHETERPAMEQALRLLIETGRECSLEHRLCRSDEPVRWVLSRARLSRSGAKPILSGISIDITERVLAEQRVRLELGLMKMARVTQSDSMADVIAEVCTVMKWECGALWAPRADEPGYHCLCSWGVRMPQVTAFLSASDLPAVLDVDWPTVAAARREPVVSPDILRDDHQPRLARAAMAGLRAAVAVPVMYQDAIHVLEFFSAHVLRPDAELDELMKLIAAHAARRNRRPCVIPFDHAARHRTRSQRVEQQ